MHFQFCLMPKLFNKQLINFLISNILQYDRNTCNNAHPTIVSIFLFWQKISFWKAHGGKVFGAKNVTLKRLSKRRQPLHCSIRSGLNFFINIVAETQVQKPNDSDVNWNIVCPICNGTAVPKKQGFKDGFELSLSSNFSRTKPNRRQT